MSKFFRVLNYFFEIPIFWIAQLAFWLFQLAIGLILVVGPIALVVYCCNAYSKDHEFKNWSTAERSIACGFAIAAIYIGQSIFFSNSHVFFGAAD